MSANIFTVSILADSGAGSLRQAITSADSAGGTNLINFANGLTGTINLASALPALGASITIDGPGASVATVNGKGQGSVFTINSGVTAEIDNLTITGGTSTSGGGIFNGINGTLTVTNSTISGNSASRGGGIYNLGTLAVSNSTISGNSAASGGGIYSLSNTLTTLSGCTISGNSAAALYGFGGGGIDNRGTFMVTNSTISGNSASDIPRSPLPAYTAGGGGIVNFYILTVTNSTVSGNSAASDGGGIKNSYNLTVTDSTISGNSAFISGGGIDSYHTNRRNTLTVNGTVVAANSGGDLNLLTVTLSGANDLIGDGSDGGVFTNSLRGTTTNPLNPLLSPLGTFGGPTLTRALLPGSPAIGGGANFPVLDANNNDITATDQRGIARPQGTDFDIGAFQSYVTPHAPSITSAGGVTFLTAFTASFTVDTIGFPTAALTETPALPTGVTFVDNGNGTATLSETVATNTAGTFHLTITASNGVAPNATQAFTLTVLQSQAPAITSANAAIFLDETNGAFTVTSTGFPTPTLTETVSLPSGVTFVNNGDGTGTLLVSSSTSTGVFDLTFDATNGIAPAASQAFTLTVGTHPAIVSVSSAPFIIGFPGTFTVKSTGFPIAALTETGMLPSGISFVDNGNGTASLSGTPQPGTVGTYNLTLTANNGVTPNATQSFDLNVNQPQTFTVTTTADSGTGTLRQAIDSADGTADATINFASGVTGTIDLAGQLPFILSSMTIDGPGSSLLTINGQGHGSVFVVDPGVTQIENLTITDGNGVSYGGKATYGGGILNDGTLTVTNCILTGNTSSFGGGIESGGALTVTDSTISGNTVTSSGGGIAEHGSSALFTVSGSTISGNSASNAGGGILNLDASLMLASSTISGNSAGGGGGIDNVGTLTVTGSAISGNTASDEGGGIQNYGATAALTVNNSTISANSSSESGGGISNYKGTLNIADSTLTGNSSSNGGGLYNYSKSTLTLTSSTISGNSAGVGGGVYNVGTLTVTDSTLNGNSALYGGGIDNGGTLNVTNSTLSGNSASGGGGIDNNSGTTTVANSTLSGNSANRGGGIYAYHGKFLITNSTVSGNSAKFSGGGIENYDGVLSATDSTVSGNASSLGGGVDVYSASAECTFDGTIVATNSGGDILKHKVGAMISGSEDLIGDGSDGGVLTGSLRGTTASPLNPMLAPILENFGGPTQTLALLPGSPALGTGANFNNLNTDQRGFARPTTSGIDIGADQGALFAGDTNFDGTVNLTDLLTLLNNYGETGKGWTQGDFNFDGTVNLTDLLALLNNYGLSANDTSVVALANISATSDGTGTTLRPEAITLNAASNPASPAIQATGGASSVANSPAAANPPIASSSATLADASTLFCAFPITTDWDILGSSIFQLASP